MIKKLLTLLLVLCGLINLHGSSLDSLYQMLDNDIKNHKVYMEERELRIKEIKKLLHKNGANLQQQYILNTQIFEEYRAYVFDSAIYYLNNNLKIAKSLNNQKWKLETKFKLSTLLSVSGNYIESMQILQDVKKSELTEDLIIDYYSCFAHLYNELSFHTQLIAKSKHYKERAKAYKDSVLMNLSPESEMYLFHQESILFSQNKMEESMEINSIFMASSKFGTPDFAFVAFRRAMLYRQMNDRENEKRYLILSAISDIRSAIKENVSLTLLAFILYEENKIDKAYHYIKFSMDDAQFYNSRLRFIEISNILPLINHAYESKVTRQNSQLRKYLLLISLLTIFVALAFSFIVFQVKKLSKARTQNKAVNNQLNKLNDELVLANDKLKDLNLELAQNSHIKEQYIGHFLSRCSDYIDKLNSYRRYVNKQITTGKIKELVEKTSSHKFIDNELKEYYDNFDNTFLHIYPDFVEEFNSLLLENERIIVKKGEVLNTEIRIFALIRLGVTDSSKIAKLLRYSVNTIYNYRVKIKNKSAISRDEFENEVMKIGTFVIVTK